MAEYFRITRPLSFSSFHSGFPQREQRLQGTIEKWPGTGYEIQVVYQAVGCKFPIFRIETAALCHA